jgi:hypothetical protein
MNVFRTIPQIAALSLFVIMVGGLVIYRCRTSKPVEYILVQTQQQPPDSSQYSFSSTLRVITHERLPSSKIGIIFSPKDTAVTHETMHMRQNITRLTASDTAEYAVIYRRIVKEAAFLYRYDGKLHTLDSLNAWLLFKFRPEKLKTSYPKDLTRLQKILEENDQKVPDEHKKYIKRRSNDTLVAIKQLLYEKWPR